MDAETIVFRVEGAIAPKSLNPLQRCVLKGSLDDLGYNIIAEKYGYGEGHVRDTGSKLWKDLSPLVGQRITKRDVRGIFQHWLNQQPSRDRPEAGPVHWGETVDLGNFYGREAEQEELQRWITVENRRLIGVFGCPGKGKTALTLKVARQIAPQFERVFWQRLRAPLPLEELLPIWLRFLSQDDSLTIPSSLSKKLDVFLELLSQWRSLLVLDGLDVLFSPQQTAAVFLPGYENYGQFLQLIGEVKHKSCLLLTSREKLLGFSTLEGNSSPVRSLKLSGFGTEVGALVL
ncbi:MAG: NB-ARC domain-containing protein, partial [Microcystaceae cyanobacterium]